VKGHDFPVLVAKIGELTCAIPIALVVETMRPLPVEPLGHGAAYVRGVAIIRGAPVIVIDLAALFAVTSPTAATRFVVVRTGNRQAALMVDAVIAIRNLGTDDGGWRALPPLAAAAAHDVISSIGAIDAELVVVLETARLLEAVA
jgi:purine-binding chemotaxis protein CheW